ncbi:MAG TPA: type II toxin-antitoxin system VapC family toxin [Thermoanaerobaculia bacterium]|nr:type II toxin-antitoxin system VapC family toxin [Thermoanaerobaculia bacterium]
MIGLDTNVLVRYLVEDDPDQTARAAELIYDALDADDRLFLPEIVLCEVVWVLQSAYRLPRQRIVEVLRDLLRTRQLAVEQPESARRALDRYAEGSADFADYLILDRCRAAGCDRVASFDTGLQAEEGVFPP